MKAATRASDGAEASLRCGIDAGGTFTDFVVQDGAGGRQHHFKLPSTPRDPSRAIAAGLERLAADGFDPARLGFFAHGTTVGTNALLEGRAARTGLLITEGFRGVYETGDQTRGYGAATYDLRFEKPPPLVPQRLTWEVRERVASDGTVLVPLEAGSVRAAARAMRGRVDSVAVCFLFSFLHPDHERAAAAILAEELPGVPLSLSSAVLAQIREYPRLSTTVVNACLAPVMAGYLGQVEGLLGARRVPATQRYVMQSSGGVCPFAAAAERPVTTILSGPAAGALAGARLAGAAGHRNVITFDMGGTSCDVALIEDGHPLERARGRIAGRDVALPMLDIETVSAGGGTIAWVDSVGDLRLGPDSAGADPGPVCYGRGGRRPTVTDADLVLGLLDPDYFLGGAMRLDAEAAREAIAQQVAEPLGIPLDRAAWGVVRVVNGRMADAIRTVSTSRGYDLRGFTLFAFGGAGPVHAAQVADLLGISRVLVPALPGVTSALGLLLADLRHDYVRSRLGRVDDAGAPARAAEVFGALRAEADEDVRREGLEASALLWRPALDMRYLGQGYELTVPVPTTALDGRALAEARAAFDGVHGARFGHSAPDQPVEVVSYRLSAVLPTPMPIAAERGLDARGPAPQPDASGTRPVAWEGRDRRAWPVFRRPALRPGHAVAGPAVLEQEDSTIVLPPGWTAAPDAAGHLLLTGGEAS